MKKRRRNQVRKYRQPRDDRAQVVKELAAAGLSGDVIAAALAIGKNRLRAEHALDIHAGRTAKNEAAKAAAATALNKEDAERLERIKRAFNSHWFDPVNGCDLYGGAKTIEEALAWCAQFKSARKTNGDSDDV
jgi:DNA-binding transcriptional MerR regulator